MSCSNRNEELAATAQTPIEGPSQTHIALEDGVYPVVLVDKAFSKRDGARGVVELMNVPVEGSEDAAPEKIRVIARPLVRFQNLSKFDFTFAKNERTEVGFDNTDELKAYTRDHVGSRLAVVIDSKVVSHHKIREAITSERVRITCCTVGGGDHLHKYLKELRAASNGKEQP